MRPVSRRRLYWTARGVLVTDRSQLPAFNAVFFSVFGADRDGDEPLDRDDPKTVSAPPDRRPGEERGTSEGDAAHPNARVDLSAAPPAARDDDGEAEVDVPLAMASDEELLSSKRFDALEPHELAPLYRLMSRLRARHPAAAHAPLREGPPRPAHRDAPDAAREPAHRRATRSASRAGAAGSCAGVWCCCATSRARWSPTRAPTSSSSPARPAASPDAEAFAFATRLTRLTRALRSRNPERAIQRAAAAAPDWSSGTRIGDALKTFNDRHGRRGMARGAVVVILSDGWERGDPELVGREMERLSRLAHRIVWVNPRAAAAGFSVRRRRDGGGAAPLRRAAERPQPAGARRGRRRHRRGRRARAAARRRAGGGGGAVGERDARRGQLGRDAERLRAQPREDDAGMAGGMTEPRICIYPGCERPAVPPHPLGGPQPAFCDLEEHNALTAHQERQRLASSQNPNQEEGR